MLIPLLLWSCIAAITPPLFVADVRWLRLPNRLLLLGTVGLVAATAAGGLLRLATLDAELPWARAAPFEAGCAALLVFAALRMLGAVGMGDVKLAGVLAAALGFLPPQNVVPALGLGVFVAAATGGAAALAIVPTTTARTHSMPFGPFLLAGFWFALLHS